MRERKLIQYEIRQLLWKKTVWCVLGVVLLLPVINVTGLLGRTSLNLFHSMQQGSVTDTYILYPIFNSLTISCLAVSILMAYELDWVKRSNALSILESTQSSQGYLLRKVVAMCVVTAGVILLLILTLWPYTAAKMGNLFGTKAYLTCWVYLYLGGLVISLLLTGGLYLMTNSLAGSVTLLTVLLVVLPALQANIDITASQITYKTYLTQMFTPQQVAIFSWLQTPVERLSDGTGNGMQFQIMAYYRGIWLLIGMSVLMLGTVWNEKQGLRRTRGLPVALFVCTATGAMAMILAQPFYYKGTQGLTIDNDPAIKLDVTLKEEVDSSIHIPSGRIQAEIDGEELIFRAKCSYDVLIDDPGGRFGWSFRLPAGMEVKSVTQDGNAIPFVKAERASYYTGQFDYVIALERKAAFTLGITYEGAPKNGFYHPMYMITKDYVDIPNWAPELFCGISTDQIISVVLTLPEHLQPVGINYNIREIACNREGYRAYDYMTFALGNGDLTAGRYGSGEFHAEDLQVQLIYFSSKEQQILESDLLNILQQTVVFFQDSFGPPRLFNYDGSQILTFVERSTNPDTRARGNTLNLPESQMWELDEQGRIQVEDGVSLSKMVELLANQWWKYYIREGEYLHDPWTTDGMAKYCTYLFMKRFVGEEFAQTQFVEKWIAEKNYAMNTFYAVNPDYLIKLPISMQERLTEQQIKNSLQDYSQLVIYKAAELVGEETFLTKLKEMRTERNNSYERFLEIMGLTKEQLELD